MCKLSFQAQISVPFNTKPYLCLNKSCLNARQSVNTVHTLNFKNLSVETFPMALKIVYQICCGIDVPKTFVVARTNI